MALVGPNGAGKSTLMRTLAGVDHPDGGERLTGHNVVIDYFAQDQAAVLGATRTVYEEMTSASSTTMVPVIRTILGGFLFSGDDVYKKVGVLSGGERNRLALAKMLLNASNVLILDEPTNHLDLDSKEVLLEALEDYGGTLIFVSHDRYFVDKLATKVIEVGGGQTLVYPGGYEDFVYWKKQREAGVAVALPSGRRLLRATRTASTRSTTGRRAAPRPAAAAAATPPAGEEGEGSRRRRPRPRARATAEAATIPLAPRLRPPSRRRPPGTRARGAQAQGAHRRAGAPDRGEGAGGARPRAPHGVPRLLRRPRARRSGGGRPAAARWTRWARSWASGSRCRRSSKARASPSRDGGLV